MSQYADTSAAPVCPRHPDRVSYVRCQRCERPVCPECQVPGAVGVHCVDCARSAQAARRGARTILGGSVVADALLTKVLIGACVLVFIAQQVLGSLTSDLLFAPAVALSEPWRFLTTAFLHSSLMHLAFNMWALWVTGTALEPVLGRWRFGALYGLSALGGSVMVYLLASPSGASWWTGTVGASGAVFGLFAALFVIQRRFGRDTSAIVGLLAVNLVISFTGASISWQGHLGGLLTGAAVAALFAWAPRERRKAVGLWGPVGVGLVLLILIAVKALVS
ncbi:MULTISPECIES: rhomboid family intramembrane serine protease [Actinomyces]|uniref:Rhomboid family intramembrane serine protease n=1 Tax=Actinomyces respiraculi TaxID=2744574 RepID=A0A7T0LLA9_9ACTO|nr:MULTISPECIES: rhomboid family intramembrane serine protease [Actinomyces]QPL05443.1 rhomboid family intramembrane serine protease [Actinomyces respiraculi]